MMPAVAAGRCLSLHVATRRYLSLLVATALCSGCPLRWKRNRGLPAKPPMTRHDPCPHVEAAALCCFTLWLGSKPTTPTTPTTPPSPPTIKAATTALLPNPPCRMYHPCTSPIGPAAAEMTGTPVHYPPVRRACVSHSSLSASGKNHLPMLHPATSHRQLCYSSPSKLDSPRKLDAQTMLDSPSSLNLVRAAGKPSARQAPGGTLRRVSLVGSARMTSLMQSQFRP
jgi:hypothetical protein